uniref:Uncharacterized protein LOC111104920 n=1 Tax=Crassostrea virginica TaxID=6565 RepID=A0A8B8AUD6_CRAVI|nr:uncharacterized protein LOC111104920 [Crassostrea virginica]
MPQTEERFFIPHLAVADLLSTVCLACLGISLNYYYTDFPNETLCQMLHYFSWQTTSWSTFILLMISVSRYLKICQPTGKQMTRFWKKCAVYGCLIFTIINTSPVLYFTGNRYQNVTCLNSNITVVICELRDFDRTVNNIKNAYIFFEIFVLFGNAGITTLLYIPIGLQIYRRFKGRSNHINTLSEAEYSASAATKCSISMTELTVPKQTTELEAIDASQANFSTARKQSQQVEEMAISGQEFICKYSLTNGNNQENSNTVTSASKVIEHIPAVCKERRFESKVESNIRVRNNFTYMFMTIIIFYLLSYLPTFIIILLATEDPFQYWYSMDVITLNFIMILRRSSIINHIVNPFIYGYFDRVFRERFIEVFICK